MPAAVICTEAFIPTARAQAAICGNADYRFAVVPHLVGSLSAAELRERAQAAAPQVIAILTGADPAGAAREGP